MIITYRNALFANIIDSILSLPKYSFFFLLVFFSASLLISVSFHGSLVLFFPVTFKQECNAFTSFSLLCKAVDVWPVRTMHLLTSYSQYFIGRDFKNVLVDWTAQYNRFTFLWGKSFCLYPFALDFSGTVLCSLANSSKKS